MSKRYIKRIQKNNKSNMKQRYNYLQLLNAIKLEQFDIKHSKFLDNNNLSTFTYNKSIQKIIESTRVDKETKEELKKIKK